MKFCFACLVVVFLSYSVEGTELGISGQLQILNVVYQKMFVENKWSNQMSIRGCFCSSITSYRLCYDGLFKIGNSAITSVLDNIIARCQKDGNYLVGVPDKLATSSDLYPPRLNSSFLANFICEDPSTIHCTPFVKVGTTGLTGSQMATLLNDFGSIKIPPSSICTNAAIQASLAVVVSQYPQSLQDKFNTAIVAACMKNNMTDVTSMTDLYLNVVCPPTGCTYSMLIH